MGIILGIDVGGSTTKIVGMKPDGTLISTMLVKAYDQLTSLYGALGNYMDTNRLELSSVQDIYITGVGSSYLNGNIYGIPTHRVEEFSAIGMGGLFLAGIDQAIVISMGTGTAFVQANKGSYKHIGGSGVGGGTLIGLGCRMTGAACSQPGEASFQMTTLLSASCRQRRPRSLAKRTHRSLTCFVLPLPCGTELRYSKYEKTSFGSRFDNTPMLCPVLSVDTLFYHMRGALSIRRRRMLFFARHLE